MFDKAKTLFLFLLTLTAFVLLGIFFVVIMHFDGAAKVYVWSIFAIYMNFVLLLLMFTWYRDFLKKRMYESAIFVIITLIITIGSVLFYNVKEYIG